MKAVIIDDEQNCVSYLQELLLQYCPQITEIQSFTHSKEGQQHVVKSPPDILFIDIEMPNMNGFDVLAAFLPNIPFSVVFTTAYDRYAIRAFKFGAIDYLLKPINRHELMETVARIEAKPNPISQQNWELMTSVSPNTLPEKIALSTATGLHIVKVSDIIYCKADTCYTYFYLKHQPPILISKPIKDATDMLEGEQFMRIHHSYLVNLSEIVHYIRGEGGEVRMANDDVLPVSRSKKQALLESFEKL